MSSHSVVTDTAPLPIGPYSQAVACGDLLFVSGQIPLDATTGMVVGESIEAQARQAINNLSAILESQGFTTEALVKTTVFLKDMGHFAAFNTVYERLLGGARPARSVVAVAGLPKNVLIEIEAVACR
jgi:2-iminobutanoate/2-iminopropanoate deaminase